MPSSKPCRRLVFYSGRVQGVGFRYTARQIAQGFAVTGYVRNLPDGRVELACEGAEDEVGRFLGQIADELKPYIVHSDAHEAAATNEFSTFEIRA